MHGQNPNPKGQGNAAMQNGGGLVREAWRPIISYSSGSVTLNVLISKYHTFQFISGALVLNEMYMKNRTMYVWFEDK
jgi:hypothetical protein